LRPDSCIELRCGDVHRDANTADVEFGGTGMIGAIVNSVFAGIASVLAIGIAVLLSSAIVALVRAMIFAMSCDAAGDKSVAIPGMSRADEIGGMAKDVNVFKENVIEADRLRAAQEQAKARAEAAGDARSAFRDASSGTSQCRKTITFRTATSQRRVRSRESSRRIVGR
jgi:HAMP domain-containing protein